MDVGDGYEFCGWLGQACFFARFLVQWLASERVGRPQTPTAFWVLSIAGAVFSFAYSWLGTPHDVVFAAGYALNAAVFVRNLDLALRPHCRRAPRGAGVVALLLCTAATAALLRDPAVAARFGAEPPLWLATGILGQILWSGRFFAQWAQAEASGRAELTPRFFVISLLGWAALFPYALWTGALPFVAGLSLPPLVIVRNLALFRAAARRAESHRIKTAKP